MALNSVHKKSQPPISIHVDSPNVIYSKDKITSYYTYQTVHVNTKSTHINDNQDESDSTVSTLENSTPITKLRVIPKSVKYRIETCTRVPRSGILLVGLGGNNGSSLVGGLLCERLGLSWETKRGEHLAGATVKGSILAGSTISLGYDIDKGKEVYVQLKRLLPFCEASEWVVGGWDISSVDMGEAMRRAMVLDKALQDKLYVHMKAIHPMKGIYRSDFIANNQTSRADHILKGPLSAQLTVIRQNIQNFKIINKLDNCMVLWTANTERFVKIIDGVHDTPHNIFQAIHIDHPEISPSQIYAIASILEGCSYINASPQNTFVPAIIQMAKENNVFLGGNDLKSGQTKFKSVMMDFLLSAGFKVRSVASYNHLGNNDGYNLSSPQQFRSKEISKSSLVDEMVHTNHILYENDEIVDQTVVIKHIPFVGDSKRAMDEYISEIYLDGLNTIVVHNTCEDSLLAVPLIIDMLLLTELFNRIHFFTYNDKENIYNEKPLKMQTLLSILSYFCKSPQLPYKHPIIHSLYTQKACIVNILKACIGLPPDNSMALEYKL